ncbi:MAG: TetR family transcriptional regulator [Bacteroidetes bacterium]|nr:TetR family transcriptional regulator [Bacteroidota bacterium]MDA0874805.1 TetR family transcriptional regulator [Bacteroidota bacterium]
MTAAEISTESAIFDAALRVFSRKGKDGARMQEIADEAGINKAMLHYYFRNKDSLYEAVFAHVIGRFFSEIDRAMLPGRPFVESMEGMIHVYMDMHAAQPEVARLWVQENLNGAPVARSLIERHRNADHPFGPHRLLARIREAADAGEIRAVDPVHLMMTVLGMTVMTFIATPTLSVFDPSLRIDSAAMIDARKRHIVEVLTHGITI